MIDIIFDVEKWFSAQHAYRYSQVTSNSNLPTMATSPPQHHFLYPLPNSRRCAAEGNNGNWFDMFLENPVFAPKLRGGLRDKTSSQSSEAGRSNDEGGGKAGRKQQLTKIPYR